VEPAKDDKNTKKESSIPMRKRFRFVECCQYVVTKKIRGTVYGRECGNVVLNGEEKCPKHVDEPEKEYNQLWPYCCKAEIPKRGTGVPEELSRKGLLCGEFCEENKQYCTSHTKSASKDKNAILRGIKVRLYPSLRVRKILAQWFGCARWTYNQLVEKNPENEFSGKLNCKQKSVLQHKYEKELVTNCPDYATSVPYHIRRVAVEEYFIGAVNAYNKYEQKIEWERVKHERDNNYEIKEITIPKTLYRSKKDQQCISLPNAWASITSTNKGKAHPVLSLRAYPMILKEQIPIGRRNRKNRTLIRIMNTTGIQYDYKLIKTESNKYYMCLPYAAQKHPNTSNKQAASDSGAREFQTVYSPQGDLREYGHECNLVIRERLKTINNLKKLYYKGSLRHDKQLKRKRILLQDKLTNMVDDLHHKTAYSLCSEYNTIIIPHFAVSQMVKSDHMYRGTKREILTLGHGKFRNRLIAKAELLNCTLLIPDNEFQTTMTCGLCFRLNRNVGVSKVFECEHCSLRSGRDVNAPRNIFIRQLVSQ
jgi:putative transposase